MQRESQSWGTPHGYGSKSGDADSQTLTVGLENHDVEAGDQHDGEVDDGADCKDKGHDGGADGEDKGRAADEEKIGDVDDEAEHHDDEAGGQDKDHAADEDEHLDLLEWRT